MSTGSTESTQFTNPNNTQTPSHQTTSNENFIGPGNGNTGVLGPDGTPLGSSNTTPISYTKTQSDQDMALDTIKKTINEAPGKIERLSVSVLLDSSKVGAGDQSKWEQALTTAAGIDTNRNDALQVTRVAFDKEASKQAAANLSAATGEASKTQMLDMVRHLVTFMIVGLVLFLAWRSIKKAEVNRVPIRVPLDLRELEAAEMMRLEPAMADAAPRLAAAQYAAEPARAPLEAQQLPVEDEIAGIIDQQPDEVALTLRSWLADRRG
jgi:flagellar M-ring protein FliF